ncbi:MAG: hypothetical protein K8T26_11935 [Lentisphaerae bacterium]|nr:hypothetical protein [Lentisphaerota bacterium]
MQTSHRSSNRREGSALFTVMLIVLVIAALLGITCKASVQRVFTARKLADRVRALSIAEAGANKAYAILQNDFNARLDDTPFPLTSYAGGTYDVSVATVGVFVAVVSSEGHYGTADAQVVVDVKNYGASSNAVQNSSALNYSILCGGTFDFGGCGTISSSNGAALLHSNGGLTIRGDAQVGLDIRSSTKITLSNGVDINGRVTSPTLSYNASKVTSTGGFFQQAVPLVPIPDLDFTPFNAWAASHGEVKNGGWSLSGGTYNANGGVIWVNGDVQISSSTIVNGSIFATGSIKLAGSAVINHGDSGIAIAARDGNIDYQTSGATYGMIYAKTGSFTQTSNGRMEGQMIIKGNINKGGASDEMLYVKTILTTPGVTSSASDLIGVSAWQK